MKTKPRIEISLHGQSISDMTHLCRVCMSGSNVAMTEIFNKPTDKDSISHRIQFCTGLELESYNGLPTQICSLCLITLDTAYKFKTNCLESDKTYKELLQNLTLIKTEPNFMKDIDEFIVESVKSCDENRTEVKQEISEVIATDTEDNLATNEYDSTEHKDKGKRNSKKRGPYKKRKAKEVTTPRRRVPTYRRLYCDSCDIRFKVRQHFEEHKKECHAEDSSSWVCEVCGKVYSRGSKYTHIQSHYPPEFGCSDCSYKTWYKHDLVKHIMTHTDEKKYQCECCTNRYRTSSALSSHIKRSHENLKKFFCDICSHGFFERNKWQRHMDMHSNIKRYACDVCHSKFTRRCHWKKHLQKQHGISTPAQKPGRQKTNYIVGQDLMLAPDKLASSIQ